MCEKMGGLFELHAMIFAAGRPSEHSRNKRQMVAARFLCDFSMS